MEDWKIIEGTDYEVSTSGKVRRGNTNVGITSALSQYPMVRLTINGSVKIHYIHRLVAMAFIENPDPTTHTVVNHIDGDKWNNDVMNLEWVTPSYNIKHSYSTGLKPKSSWCESHVKALCKRCYCEELDMEFESPEAAGRYLNKNPNVIRKCCKGERMTAHKMHWKYI